MNRIKKEYNLNIHDIKNLMKKQDNLCPICLEKLPINYVIDHCHKTGKVRGLLCRRCNTSLGLFRDNTKVLNRAIRYLKRNNEEEV